MLPFGAFAFAIVMTAWGGEATIVVRAADEASCERLRKIVLRIAPVAEHETGQCRSVTDKHHLEMLRRPGHSFSVASHVPAWGGHIKAVVITSTAEACAEARADVLAELRAYTVRYTAEPCSP